MNKVQVNKSKSTAHKASENKSSSKGTFQFLDNRPETLLQHKLMQMANNGTKEQLPLQKKAVLEEEELLQGKFVPIQRQALEEEEQLQGKFKTAQRKSLEEEELQMKAAPLQKKTSPEQSRRENNTGLPDNLRSGIESLSGYSMDDVKVHYNSNQPAKLNAHAYAQGRDIHLASGQEKHLPHEAWHVVQQKQGRVKPTLQMKGKVNVNDDVGLEKEADVMGAKALKLQQSEKSTFVFPIHEGNPITQRASISQVESCLGGVESPAAASKRIIVEDLARKTGGEEIGFDETPTPWIETKKQVKIAALKIGYSENAAERLVEHQPFIKADIKGNSTIIKNEGKVTSFYGVTKDAIQPQNHQLFFANTYKKGNWTMSDNFRNPYLASFFGNEVVEEQKLFVNENGKYKVDELRVLTRENIVSESGVNWAKDNNIKDGLLNPNQLRSFMETENGRSSERIADNHDVLIVGGKVSDIVTTGELAFKYFKVDLYCEDK